jgi:hypothetical protein
VQFGLVFETSQEDRAAQDFLGSLQVFHFDLVASGSPQALDAGPRAGRGFDVAASLRWLAGLAAGPVRRSGVLPELRLAEADWVSPGQAGKAEPLRIDRRGRDSGEFQVESR